MGADDQDRIGPNGVPFPSENEWLDLPAPPAGELTITPDFVERTLQALVIGEHAPEALLTADRLRAFAAPEPSPTFVAETLHALRHDKKARWRELLTRHIAPEPSPQFVARTLAALAADRGGVAHAQRTRPLPRWRRAALPLLAAAAAAALWLLLRTPPQPPIELRFAQQEPEAFAQAYAGSPLAAVLETRNRSQDPYALAEGGPDGAWLWLEAGR